MSETTLFHRMMIFQRHHGEVLPCRRFTVPKPFLALLSRRYVKIHYGSDARVRKRFFQRLRRPEIKYYIGHYDSKKYHEKMKQYKEGKIKSRPNGRTWCLLNENLHFINRDEKETSLRRYYEFYSSLRSKYRASKARKKEV